MPYESKAQQAYFNANREKMEAQGVDVDEWNASSKGMKLPARSRAADRQRKLRDRYAKAMKR